MDDPPEAKLYRAVMRPRPKMLLAEGPEKMFEGAANAQPLKRTASKPSMHPTSSYMT